MWRRKQEPPQRRPHPDPRVEAELQRIISHRRAIARKEGQLDANRADIASIRDRLRRRTGSLNAGDWKRHVAALTEESAELEAEIDEHHEIIGKMAAEMSDSDLAYL